MSNHPARGCARRHDAMLRKAFQRNDRIFRGGTTRVCARLCTSPHRDTQQRNEPVSRPGNSRQRSAWQSYAVLRSTMHRNEGNPQSRRSTARLYAARCVASLCNATIGFPVVRHDAVHRYATPRHSLQRNEKSPRAARRHAPHGAALQHCAFQRNERLPARRSAGHCRSWRCGAAHCNATKGFTRRQARQLTSSLGVASHRNAD